MLNSHGKNNLPQIRFGGTSNNLPSAATARTHHRNIQKGSLNSARPTYTNTYKISSNGINTAKSSSKSSKISSKNSNKASNKPTKPTAPSSSRPSGGSSSGASSHHSKRQQSSRVRTIRKPTQCMTPVEAIRRYANALTPFEQAEILEYKQVHIHTYHTKTQYLLLTLYINIHSLL